MTAVTDPWQVLPNKEYHRAIYFEEILESLEPWTLLSFVTWLEMGGCHPDSCKSRVEVEPVRFTYDGLQFPTVGVMDSRGLAGDGGIH